jgi:hypothetical protein
VSDNGYADLREARATAPDCFGALAAIRKRRPLLGDDGKLFLVAADHPARAALGVGNNPMAMADRYDLLDRLRVALATPGVDGVLATPDIIEDLLFFGALEDKIVAGSINRGGLANSTFELDDRPTGYSPAALHRDRLDFAKILLRVDRADPSTVSTLETAGRLVSESAALQLPIFIEPFMSSRVHSRVVNELTAEAMVTAVSIASGLGDTSAFSWLKIPVVDDMERVMAATTLPTLLLGGDPGLELEEIYAGWEGALAIPGVRGLVAGRTLLYPADGNVSGAIAAAADLVHATRYAAIGS